MDTDFDLHEAVFSPSRRFRKKPKLDLKSVDLTEMHSILESLYKIETKCQLKNSLFSSVRKSDHELMEEDIKKVKEEILENFKQKAEMQKRISSKFATLNKDENQAEKSKQDCFRESVIEIPAYLKTQEKFSKFSHDPNAFYVYKQRSGFVKIRGKKYFENRGRNKKLNKTQENKQISLDMNLINPMQNHKELNLPKLYNISSKMQNIQTANNTPKPLLSNKKNKNVSLNLNNISVLLFNNNNTPNSEQNSPKYNPPEFRQHRIQNRHIRVENYNERRLSSICKLQSIIENCKNIENAASNQLKISKKRMRITKAELESCKKVSKKMSDIAFVHPSLMKQLFYQRKKEESEQKAEMEQIIFNYRNSPGDRKKYKKLYPSAHRIKEKQKEFNSKK